MPQLALPSQRAMTCAWSLHPAASRSETRPAQCRHFAWTPPRFAVGSSCPPSCACNASRRRPGRGRWPGPGPGPGPVPPARGRLRAGVGGAARKAAAAAGHCSTKWWYWASLSLEEPAQSDGYLTPAGRRAAPPGRTTREWHTFDRHRPGGRKVIDVVEHAGAAAAAREEHGGARPAQAVLGNQILQWPQSWCGRRSTSPTTPRPLRCCCARPMCSTECKRVCCCRSRGSCRSC